MWSLVNVLVCFQQSSPRRRLLPRGVCADHQEKSGGAVSDLKRLVREVGKKRSTVYTPARRHPVFSFFGVFVFFFRSYAFFLWRTHTTGLTINSGRTLFCVPSICWPFGVVRKNSDTHILSEDSRPFWYVSQTPARLSFCVPSCCTRVQPLCAGSC